MIWLFLCRCSLHNLVPIIMDNFFLKKVRIICQTSRKEVEEFEEKFEIFEPQKLPSHSDPEFRKYLKPSSVEIQSIPGEGFIEESIDSSSISSEQELDEVNFFVSYLRLPWGPF